MQAAAASDGGSKAEGPLKEGTAGMLEGDSKDSISFVRAS